MAGRGKRQTEFKVHENTLRQHSEFFRRALKQEWAEGKEKRVELCEESPSTVRKYVQWLYSQSVAYVYTFKTRKKTREDMIRDYIFADQIQDLKFKDAIMNELLLFLVNSNFTKRSVNKAFSSLPQQDPLYKLMVQHYAEEIPSDYLQSDGMEGWPYASLFLLAQTLMSKSHSTFGIGSRYRLTTCDYHNHGKEACETNLQKIKAEDYRFPVPSEDESASERSGRESLVQE